MNTCDTCKHWKRSPFAWEENQGSCQHSKLSNQLHEDLDDKVGVDELATYSDDPYCASGFLCGPKFGCIHHEAKPVEPDTNQMELLP